MPRRAFVGVYLAMLSPVILMLIVFGGWGTYFAVTRGLRGAETGTAMAEVAFPAALIVFAATFAVGALLVRRDGLRLTEIGWGRLTAQHVLVGVGAGIAVGLLYAVLVAPLIKKANPAFDPLLTPLSLWQLLLLQVAGVAAEDTVFRGYPLTRLRERFAPLICVVISSAFYALLNATQGLASLAWAFVLGLGFGALFYVQKSLWPTAIAHYLIALVPRFLHLLFGE